MFEFRGQTGGTGADYSLILLAKTLLLGGRGPQVPFPMAVLLKEARVRLALPRVLCN
jgi:hypothetical protein